MHHAHAGLHDVEPVSFLALRRPSAGIALQALQATILGHTQRDSCVAIHVSTT